MAGMRLLLGRDNPLVSVSANTAQLQEHLPPIDTIDATAKTRDGVTGVVAISFGTTFKCSEWAVASELGVVSVSGNQVTIGKDTKEVQNEGSGVAPEVRKWGEALAEGKTNQRQRPEEALADLELIEAMLRSGEQGGKPIALKYQTW